jgi:hypothetical protein
MTKASEFPFTTTRDDAIKEITSGFPATDLARKVFLLAAGLKCQSRTNKVRLWDGVIG